MLIAVIDKVQVPSFSGSYDTADTFLGAIGLMLFDRGRVKGVPLLGEHFLAKLLTPNVH